jgi:hypothetical protein
MTGDYNHRTGLMDNAFKCVNMGNHSLGTLWLPNVTIQLVKRENSNVWEEIDRDEHNLGEVTIAPDFNEQDTQFPMGRSDITPALRGHIDSGMRILLGSEIAREFFGQPLRTVTGITKEEMSDSDNQPLNPWDLIASKFIVLPGGGDGETAATMTQLPASNPENIMNLLEPTARLAAREIGLDPSYFGFSSTNPTSAEAMNFSDAKLLNKVYKRQPYVGKAWKLAARHAQLLMYGEVMEGWEDVQPVFVRAEAHSPAAAADRISKLFASKVFEQELPDFIYVELGFSPVEILQLKQWLRNSQGESLVKQLLAQNANSAEVIPPAPTPETNPVTDVTPQAGE